MLNSYDIFLSSSAFQLLRAPNMGACNMFVTIPRYDRDINNEEVLGVY